VAAASAVLCGPSSAAGQDWGGIQIGVTGGIGSSSLFDIASTDSGAAVALA